ncbi:MAG: P-II family nitrogen regulator [Nitrososphaerales archaeon]
MKKIEAIVRMEKMQQVKEKLKAIGVSGMTISQATGWGKERALHLQFGGRAVDVDLLPKTKFEVIIEDSKIEEVVRTILDSSQTGEYGDGIIVVQDVDYAINIRTGEKALQE